METITEDYVSFETAKLLKEKGFNERLLTFYITDETKKEGCFQLMAFTDDKIDNNHRDNCYVAPTLQMAMKWLREVHNIDIIAPPQYDSIKWTYSAIIFKLSIPCTEIRLNDNKDKKEEACEEAIRYCLENLICKKPAEEYNITGIGSKKAQGKLGEMINNLKSANDVLKDK